MSYNYLLPPQPVRPPPLPINFSPDVIITPSSSAPASYITRPTSSSFLVPVLPTTIVSHNRAMSVPSAQPSASGSAASAPPSASSANSYSASQISSPTSAFSSSVFSSSSLPSSSTPADVTSVLQSLRINQTYDYLRVAGNADLKGFFASQTRRSTGSTTPLGSPSSVSSVGSSFSSSSSFSNNNYSQNYAYTSPTPVMVPPPLPPGSFSQRRAESDLYSASSSSSETLYFSDEVTKINRKNKKQQRALVLSNRAIYNFNLGKYSNFKRRISLSELKAVVLSRCSDEVVFSVEESYDYRYVIQRKMEVLEILNRFFPVENYGRTLIIIYTEERELKDFVVTKEMLKKGDTRLKESLVVPPPVPVTVVYNSPEKNSISSHNDSDGTGRGGGIGATLGVANRASTSSSSPRRATISVAHLNNNANNNNDSRHDTGRSSGSLQTAQSRLGAFAEEEDNNNYGEVFPSSYTYDPNMSPYSLSLSSSSAAANFAAPPALYPPPVPDRTSLTPTNPSPSHTRQHKHSHSGGLVRVFGSGRIEGWLTKKKGTKNLWDRKFFILSGDALSYYESKIKGNIELNPKFIKVEAEPLPPSLPSTAIQVSTLMHGAPVADTKQLPYKFALRNEQTRTIHDFGSQRREEIEVWTNILKQRLITGNNSLAMEGWLYKHDSNSKSTWRLRYFILCKNRLWIFEMVHKGTIQLKSGVSAHFTKIIAPTEDPSRKNFAEEMSKTKFAYRFNVSDSARIYYMAADSEHDMNIWVEAIESSSRRFTAGFTLEKDEQKENSRISSLPSTFVEAVEQAAPEGNVTFVFTDVQNSTNLWEKAPDAMDAALEQHDRILRELLKVFRGYEVKTEGDAFMVTFFSVIEAVLWCMEVQLKLLEADWQEDLVAQPAAKREFASDMNSRQQFLIFAGIRVRMGIHTGQPNCRRNPVTGRMDYFGPVVNRSARVNDAAHGGQVVCTQEVLDALSDNASQRDPRWTGRNRPLFTDLDSHALKGVPELVKIYQLMPQALRLRTLPPIRTITNEKKAKAQSGGGDDDDDDDEEEGEEEKAKKAKR